MSHEHFMTAVNNGVLGLSIKMAMATSWPLADDAQEVFCYLYGQNVMKKTWKNIYDFYLAIKSNCYVYV